VKVGDCLNPTKIPVVEELQRLGHDVVTSLESGNAGRAVADPEVLAFARPG